MLALILPLLPPTAAGLLAWRAATAFGRPVLAAANDNQPLRRTPLDPARQSR